MCIRFFQFSQHIFSCECVWNSLPWLYVNLNIYFCQQASVSPAKKKKKRKPNGSAPTTGTKKKFKTVPEERKMMEEDNHDAPVRVRDPVQLWIFTAFSVAKDFEHMSFPVSLIIVTETWLTDELELCRRSSDHRAGAIAWAVTRFPHFSHSWLTWTTAGREPAHCSSGSFILSQPSPSSGAALVHFFRSNFPPLF